MNASANIILIAAAAAFINIYTVSIDSADYVRFTGLQYMKIKIN